MQKEIQSWTLISLLQRSTAYLQDKQFANPRLEAEQLLAKALHLRRIDLYLQYDRPLLAEEVSRFRAMLQRRLAQEPLQYIVGEAEFMSLPFYVGQGVLIPRPETEILVEAALSMIGTAVVADAGPTILDIGTGSGNVAIALAKHIRPCKVIAVDISARALEWAEKNVIRHAVQDVVCLERQDIRAEVPPQWHARFDLIAANPPYIRQQDYVLLADEIKKFEPKEALLGGEDGLEYYRALGRQLPLLLRSGGFAVMEIGADMGTAVKTIFTHAGFEHIDILPDLAGKERVVSLCYTKERTP